MTIVPQLRIFGTDGGIFFIKKRAKPGLKDRIANFIGREQSERDRLMQKSNQIKEPQQVCK